MAYKLFVLATVFAGGYVAGVWHLMPQINALYKRNIELLDRLYTYGRLK